MLPTHPKIKVWLDLSTAFALAAEAGAHRVQMALHHRRQRGYRVRRAGHESPMWTVCAKLLRAELHRYGAKARLARYLGLPRQRLRDYLSGRLRLPDAEITLRLLHWLAEYRAGRDLSL